MRKFFFTAALYSLISAALVLCAFSSAVYADAALFKGSGRLGAVQCVENNSQIFVPVSDVGSLLGFSSSRSGEELILTKGNIQLRVINNSAAAWRGLAIIPLHSAPFENNGKLWLDSSSAISLFQNTVGSGAGNKLRINKISGYNVTTANAKDNDVEFGKFEEEAKPVTVAQIPAAYPTPAINLPTIQTQTQIQTPQKTVTPIQDTEIQTAAVKSTKKSQSSKSQPKYESFKLTDSKTEDGEIYNGTAQSVRWTSQEGKHKKIRAVIMADDNADPQVFMSGRVLHALFASTLETPEKLASPFSNVKLEIKKQAEGFEFLFKPEGITKAEKIILNNPRRIVFDFFFPESVKFIGSTPTKSEPQRVAQTVQPVQPVQVETKPSTPKRPDPVITIDNSQPRYTSPAVNTPPSSITIPMSNTAASRRKTIVIDPGHGGKDPGASANGVTEKNVNLGIGLELEKVLQARGYNVVMTRRTDVYLKLQERTDIANNVKADLFVSIHVNALPSKTSMTGFEIYIMALPTDKDAMNLAKIENREYVEGKGMDTANVDRRTEMLLKILGDMQQNNKISESTDFAAALYNAGVRSSLPMRRVAQAPFFVLRGAGMPAVLLETGFVTNAPEARKLTTSAYQQQIARAMSEGIMNYLR